mmetsp:Transcript_99644/g.310337  ORF Transcript_99644/g.310337 Transcript_99644/m.310337 type:complete len:88 (+) Transcript_99644:1894-2157(+)
MVPMDPMTSIPECVDCPHSTEGAAETDEYPLGLLTQRNGWRQTTVTGKNSTMSNKPKELAMSYLLRFLLVQHFISTKTRARTTQEKG